jgi:FkbM family methyltransferase
VTDQASGNLSSKPSRSGLKLAREIFFREAREQHVSLLGFETVDGVFMVDTSDEGVGFKLFIARKRGDGQTLGRVVAELEALGAPTLSGTVFVDGGANIGTTTIVALLRFGFGRALACEPAPRNYSLLSMNIAANGLEEAVDALQVALGGEVGWLELTINPTSFGKHAVTTKERAGFERVRVPVTTLDELVVTGKLEPDAVGLIWLDTQGYEGHILAGATSLLDRGVPLVTEVHPGMLRRSGGRAPLDRMLAESYTHVLDLRVSEEPGKGFVPVQELDAILAPYEQKGFTDLLAVRVPGSRASLHP